LVISYGHEMNLTAFLVHIAQTHREFTCQAEPCAHTVPGPKVLADADGEISGYYHSS
jgi:hypothetical protein